MEMEANQPKPTMPSEEGIGGGGAVGLRDWDGFRQRLLTCRRSSPRCSACTCQ